MTSPGAGGTGPVADAPPALTHRTAAVAVNLSNTKSFRRQVPGV